MWIHTTNFSRNTIGKIAFSVNQRNQRLFMKFFVFSFNGNAPYLYPYILYNWAVTAMFQHTQAMPTMIEKNQ